MKTIILVGVLLSSTLFAHENFSTTWQGAREGTPNEQYTITINEEGRWIAVNHRNRIDRLGKFSNTVVNDAGKKEVRLSTTETFEHYLTLEVATPDEYERSKHVGGTLRLKKVTYKPLKKEIYDTRVQYYYCETKIAPFGSKYENLEYFAYQVDLNAMADGTYEFGESVYTKEPNQKIQSSYKTKGGLKCVFDKETFQLESCQLGDQPRIQVRQFVSSTDKNGGYYRVRFSIADIGRKEHWFQYHVQGLEEGCMPFVFY